MDNSDYAISETYPRNFVVPKLLSFEQIKTAAAHRSKARLPVVTYSHHRFTIRGTTQRTSIRVAAKGMDSTHCAPVLCRSAQPMVGIINKGCVEDEMLLNFYRLKGKSYPPE